MVAKRDDKKLDKEKLFSKFERYLLTASNIFSTATIYTILIGNFILTTFIIINLYEIKSAISILIPIYSFVFLLLILTFFFVLIWSILKGTNYIYKLTKPKKETWQKKKTKQKKQ